MGWRFALTGGDDMDTVLWATVFGAAVVLAAIAVRPLLLRRPHARSAGLPEPDAGERPPMALEHKRAWWSLAITLSVGAAAVALVVVSGPAVFFDGRHRLPVLALMTGAAVAYATMFTLTAWARRREHLVADERDRTIGVRAFALSWIGMLATVAVWAVVLTEVYWDEGAVPVGFLHLIFLSTLMVGILCRDVATILGYADWSPDAEG